MDSSPDPLVKQRNCVRDDRKRNDHSKGPLIKSRTAMAHCYKHLVPCSKKSINRCFSVCHYVTTLILAVGIHPPGAFFSVLCCCFLYPGLGHSGVSPSGCPFALPSDDTQNYWDSQACKLPVFTGSDISVGGFLPYVTVCCSGQNFNEDFREVCIQNYPKWPCATDMGICSYVLI